MTDDIIALVGKKQKSFSDAGAAAVGSKVYIILNGMNRVDPVNLIS